MPIIRSADYHMGRLVSVKMDEVIMCVVAVVWVSVLAYGDFL